MENLVPRAKAQAASQNRPWVPFQDRLDGWMIERRARADQKVILYDMYFYHKSGARFKSKVHVTKFVADNEYPPPTSDKNNPRPRGGVHRRRKFSTLKRSYHKRPRVSSAPSTSEAPPSTSSAPSSPKRPRINDQTTRSATDFCPDEVDASGEGESTFGGLVNHVLEAVARPESEAEHQANIANAPDPVGTDRGDEGRESTIEETIVLPSEDNHTSTKALELVVPVVEEEKHEVGNIDVDHGKDWWDFDFNGGGEDVSSVFASSPAVPSLKDGGMEYTYFDDPSLIPPNIDFSSPGWFNF
ncbi:hypothetical protein LINGRAHAP2_LOCUS37039 [Linum grandiflorum]